MTVNLNSSFHFDTSNGTIHQPFTAPKIISSLLLLLTFVFGLFGNSLYLWVLWFRMRKTITITYFSHLILANLFFTLIIPFVAVYFMMEPHWMFGLFMCKIINAFVSFTMYTSVFVLVTISIDRYCLVFHPHWYKRHMNPRYASVICSCLWILALLFTSPYLLFRQIKYDNNVTICYNDFTFSGKWNGQQIKWGLFIVRLFVGLLIPFTIITNCYLQIFIKMKKEHLARSSRPYKIMIIAILSFFIAWTPYHIWYGMSVEKGRFQESTLRTLQVLSTCLSCINSCFTPILYLFIVESFKNMFKKSVVNIIELVINETFA
ncbi:putative G-protein coupled receptor 33 isoform X2 [Mixophyes fleayi]